MDKCPICSGPLDETGLCLNQEKVKNSKTPEITPKDLQALKTFTEIYPTWWYKIGMCTVTRDFDCAPQAQSPEIEFIEVGLWPDDAFRCDHPGSLADAIHNVMNQISDARLAVHLSRSQP